MTLITLEGGDGSGKGTIAKMLVEFLKENHSVVTRREPGGVRVSEEIRKILLRPREEGMDALTELFLYEASRAQFVREFLKPALEKYDFVVLERFFDSSTAYQGYGRGLDLEMIKELNVWASDGVVPDLTIVLDLDPRVGRERVGKSEFGELDRIEKEKLVFHDRVREGFLEIARAEPDRVKVVDVETNDANDTFDIVKEHVLSL